MQHVMDCCIYSYCSKAGAVTLSLQQYGAEPQHGTAVLQQMSWLREETDKDTLTQPATM